MKNNQFYSSGSDFAMRMIALIAISCLLYLCFGCDSFTESDMPVSELNTPAVFEEKNTANAAMANVFAKIRDNGMLSGKPTGISRELGMYADELAWYGNSAQSDANFYTNTLLPSHDIVANWWTNAYSQIYAANAVIQGVAGSTKLLQADKDHLTGEAKFARALLHLYLSQLFGDVPYITGTDYTVNRNVRREPVADVYSKIIADLEDAGTLLPQEYVGPSRTRPNAFAANALLARVYLYAGMWAKASDSASEVLNNSEMYAWVPELNEVFLKESTTTIWQYAPRTATRNTDDGTSFIFNSAPPSTVALTENFMASFEPDDQRLLKWTRARNGESGTFYHAYKYKKTGGSTPQLEFTIVMRLAEQYLIRAEARARQGELTVALDDLNFIRNNAGLGNTVATTQDEILSAILHERQVELFTEFGHRFFDLKRFGAADAVLTTLKADWQTTDRLLPIPQNELNLNRNLGSQNPGY